MKLIKELIIKGQVRKRKKRSTFNDELSESFELAKDAGLDQNNSYYFSAHTEEYSLFTRLGKRANLVELWFAYYNKNGEAYVNTQTEFNHGECPLVLTCVEPLKEWRLEFNGQLSRAKSLDGSIFLSPVGEPLSASFSGVFSCTGSLYEFSRDSSEEVFARAVAAEKWTKEFFAALKENTQVHTEQAGRLSGVLRVLDSEYKIDSPAMRDHSFGKREWGYMNRHIWLMAVGEREQLNVNMVSYPALKGLKSGYYHAYRANNVTRASSLQDIALSGVPNKFEYFCKLAKGVHFFNKCNLNAVFTFVMGNSYTIYEGVADYELDSGRLKARGIAEFGYNLDKTRWN